MRVMIIGSGVSGLAVYDYLIRNGKDCFFVSDSDINNDNLTETEAEYLLKDVGFAVISPGVSLNKKIIFWIKKKKIAFLNEFDFGASKLNNNIIAVTGTNGKTTVVNLINYLLKEYKAGSVMAGNVGIPVSGLIDKVNDDQIVVLEASSFQLESVKKFSPHIAIILNVAEDHLNRHKTMSNYLKAKYKITKKQKTGDYLLLNFDDEILKNNPPKTRASIFYFSIKEKVVGVYLNKDKVYFFDGNKEIFLVSLLNIKLKGEHNLSNILASILAVYLQTHNREMLKNIFCFQGVEHRIEFVKKVNGIEFYNDSKATNIASVLVACKSFKCKINLILGGLDKNLNYDELFIKMPKNIKNIAIFGQNRDKIAFSASKCNYNYKICDTLEESVKYLFSVAKKGECVLLSPASASFDQFSNFEERGNLFKKIVEKMSEF